GSAEGNRPAESTDDGTQSGAVDGGPGRSSAGTKGAKAECRSLLRSAALLGGRRRIAIQLTAGYLALGSFSQDQVRGPLRAGVDLALCAGSLCNDGFDGIQAGVDHLRPQGTSDASPDQQ